MVTGKDTGKISQSAHIHKICGFLVEPSEAYTLGNAICHALGK